MGLETAHLEPDCTGPIEEAVVRKLRQRRAGGLVKYGVGIEHAGLTRLQWLRHAQDELLDGANYLEVLIQEEESKLSKEPEHTAPGT